MVAFSTLSGLGALSMLFSLIQHVQGVSLQVSTEGGNSSSPLLYGFMFEVCLDPNNYPVSQHVPHSYSE